MLSGRGFQAPGTQIASPRSRCRAVRARGPFPGRRSGNAASTGPLQGAAGMGRALAVPRQVAGGRMGVGRVSATGASSGVSRGGPQRARGGSTSVFINYFNQFGALGFGGSRFGAVRVSLNGVRTAIDGFGSTRWLFKNSGDDVEGMMTGSILISAGGQRCRCGLGICLSSSGFFEDGTWGNCPRVPRRPLQD
jgi:hypothetical protein